VNIGFAFGIGLNLRLGCMSPVLLRIWRFAGTRLPFF